MISIKLSEDQIRYKRNTYLLILKDLVIKFIKIIIKIRKKANNIFIKGI